MTALSEVNDFIEDTLRYNALSSYMAKTSPEDFEKFINPDGKQSSTPVEIDHEKQMKQMMEDYE